MLVIFAESSISNVPEVVLQVCEFVARNQPLLGGNKVPIVLHVVEKFQAYSNFTAAIAL